jgi:polysaccharide biosynthesis/export protein
MRLVPVSCFLLGSVTFFWALPLVALTVEPRSGANPLSEPISQMDYRIAVGDRLNLQIASVPEYSGQVVVQANGALRLPEIGDVPVRGLTLTAAEALVSAEYERRRVLIAPVVGLGLQEAAPRRISAVGQVLRPGQYSIALENSSQAPRLTSVLKQAGGVTEMADLRQIRVKRSAQMIAVDLSRLLVQGEPQVDLPLQDGDVIEVPRLSMSSTDLMNQAVSASFGVGQITVGVVGQVAKPGPLSLPPGVSLNEVIFQGGGLLPQASPVVTLYRYGAQGELQSQEITLDLTAQPGSAANPILRSRDFILVGRSFSAQLLQGISEVLSPLTTSLGAFGLFQSLFFSGVGK